MRSPAVVLIVCALLFPNILRAQPPGRPPSNLELERQLRNHPQNDQERVDLLLRTRRQPGVKSAEHLLRERAREALFISDSIGYEFGVANAYEILATSYDPFEYADSLLFFHTKAYDLFIELGDKPRAFNSYFGMGKGLAWLARYEEALNIYIEVLHYYEAENDYRGIGNVYGFIGLLYKDQRDQESARVNFLQSIEAFGQAQNDRGIERVMNDLAMVYLVDGQLKEALMIINQAIEKSESNGNFPIPFYITKGRIYIKEGSLEAAEETFIHALELIGGRGWAKEQALAYYYLSRIDLRLGKIQEARANAMEALRMNEEVYSGQNFEGRKVELISLLAETEYKLGNSGDAYIHLQRAKQISDSLTIVENLKTLADIQTKYETEKKEQEILLLQSEKKAEQRLYILVLIVVVFTFTLGVVYFWQYYRRITEQKQLKLESMKKELQQFGMVISEKNNFISKFRDDLEEVQRHVRTLEGRKELTSLVDTIHQNVNLTEDEDELFQKIEQLNAGFYSELRKRYNNLTSKDERLATLVHMDLTNKDIANILHIEADSVKQAKRRLKRKLQLKGEVDLSDYLKTLAA